VNKPKTVASTLEKISEPSTPDRGKRSKT